MALAFAPVARAGCGVVATPLAGAAPVRGAALKVVATLHPAAAGKVVVPAVDTRVARIARVQVTTRPAAGWARVTQTLTIPIAQPTLARGARGPSVRALEDRLAAL